MAFTRPKAAQIDFDVTNITDPLIRLNSGQSGTNNKDTGLVIERGSDTNVALIWDESTDSFAVINTSENGSTSGNVTISSYADLKVGQLETTGELVVGGNLTVQGTTTTVDVASINITNSFSFEGATPNGFETTLTVADPTADRTITLPDVTGYAAILQSDPGTTLITATVAELNYVDGVTSNIQTQIDNISSSFTLAADSGTNDTFTTGETLTFTGGTGIDTTVSDNTITYAIDSTVATLTGTQTLTNKTLTSPTINSATIAGTLTYSTLNDGTTSLTSTVAELNILDGVTATASELNIIDGDTSATNTTLADADRVVVNDAGTMKQVALTDFETYFETALDTLSNVTSVGTLNGLAVASSQTISLGSNRVQNVADPVGNQDAATKAYVDANAGSGGGSSGFTASTTTTAPGSDGDFDLSFNVAQTTQETPFESGGSDAFGVSLGEVYDQMEPVGSTSSVDLGVLT